MQFVKIFLFLFFFTVPLFAEDTLNVATWNIRINIREDSINGNVWSNRRAAIVKIVKDNDFDILGVQEDFNKELDELNHELTFFSRIGYPNHENGKVGSHNSIFYKKDKFALQKSGMFYFAPKEDEPMLGWNGKYIRSCTWAEFKEKKSQQLFWVFNTHMDYAGGEVERESCKMLLRKILEIAGKGASVIVMGDLNFNQYSSGYKILNESGLIEDAFITAKKKENAVGTFNKFKKNRDSDIRLDHILTTRNVDVLKYAVLLNTYVDQYGEARFPSDHFPVLVKINLKTE